MASLSFLFTFLFQFPAANWSYLFFFLAALCFRCCALASHCSGFSCCGAQALGAWASVVVARGLYSAGSVVVAHGLSCSTACGIFPDQGSNPCPLLWQVDSQLLRHQGSPWSYPFESLSSNLFHTRPQKSHGCWLANRATGLETGVHIGPINCGKGRDWGLQATDGDLSQMGLRWGMQPLTDPDNYIFPPTYSGESSRWPRISSYTVLFS